MGFVYFYYRFFKRITVQLKNWLKIVSHYPENRETAFYSTIQVVSRVLCCIATALAIFVGMLLAEKFEVFEQMSNILFGCPAIIFHIIAGISTLAYGVLYISSGLLTYWWSIICIFICPFFLPMILMIIGFVWLICTRAPVITAAFGIILLALFIVYIAAQKKATNTPEEQESF